MKLYAVHSYSILCLFHNTNFSKGGPVSAKSNGRKYLVLRGYVYYIILPSKQFLFKVNNNWITRIRCENCSRLRVKTLVRRQWRRSGVFIVNCEHISHFVLIDDSEHTNVCWVHIEKTKAFEDTIEYAMLYAVVF